MFLIMSEYLFGFRNDVTYDLYGYIFITLNNIFSAANGIYTKKKLNNTVIFEHIKQSWNTNMV